MINTKKIVNSLLEAHNDTNSSFQQNLCSRDYYEHLVAVVQQVLKENKDKDLSEIRNILFEKSGLETKLKRFFLYQKKAPGAVISFGTGNHQEKIVIGNKQEVVMNNNGVLVANPSEMQEDTIFDLASCTKLFTSVAILQLAGEERLRLDDYAKKYLPQFTNLGYHTIFDLLTYQPYHTEKRIDTAKSIDEAERILFTATPYTQSECVNKDRYNDIAPMILKYIVEEVSGMNFEEYVKENILDKAMMTSTYVNVPSDKRSRIANENYNGLLNVDGNLTIRKDANLGISTDSKAVALGQPIGVLPGHAGLFSTCDDITSFSRGLITGLVLHPALTREMAANRTLSLVKSGAIEYYPTYGFLCNSKNNNKLFSEVFQPLSGRSLSQGGWTGTHITVDPVNDINLSFLSNRVHNRLVYVDSSCKHLLKQNIDGTRTFTDKLGNTMIDASYYAYERREITDACLELALEEKILEEIVGRHIKKDTDKVKVRKIK